jgi:hypothetical protein
MQLLRADPATRNTPILALGDNAAPDAGHVSASAEKPS